MNKRRDIELGIGAVRPESRIQNEPERPKLNSPKTQKKQRETRGLGGVLTWVVTWQSPLPLHLHLSHLFSLFLLPACITTFTLHDCSNITTQPHLKKKEGKTKQKFTNFPPFFLPLLAPWDKFTPKLASLIIWVA